MTALESFSSLMAQKAVVQPRKCARSVCVCAFLCASCLNSLLETAGLAVMCSASGEAEFSVTGVCVCVVMRLCEIEEASVCD